MISDAPPSYESVVNNINYYLGDNPTPQDVLNVGSKLSDAERQVLIDNTTGKTVDLTDEQKTKMATELATQLSSSDAAVGFKQSAANATSAIQAIEQMFESLTQTLAGLDVKYTNPDSGPFAPKLAALAKTFSGVVQDSRDTAVDIAVYCETFDSVLAPVIADDSIPLADKKEVTQGFVDQSTDIKSKSDKVTQNFEGLKLDFAQFTGSFAAWSKGIIDEDNTKLHALNDDIAKLRKKISDLTISMYTLGAVTGVAVAGMAIGFIALLAAAPAAPFIFAGAVIAATVGLIVTIGLDAAKRNAEDELNSKLASRDAITNEIAEIQAAQQSVNTLAADDLTLFTHNINLLGSTWLQASADAQAALDYLNDANNATIPFVWTIYAKKDVSIYSNMAVYLRAYAAGVTLDS